MSVNEGALQKMKVLHLPSSVGGHCWGLATGEKELGLDSEVLVTSDNWLGYPYDISLGWNEKGNSGKVWACIEAFFKHRNKYDVFHFNYGSTLIDFHKYGIYHWDLPFYPKGKKIVFTFNGCDARQKYETMARISISACREEDCYNGLCNSGAMDKRRRRSINIISRYACHFFALNPDLMYFLPEEKTSFLPYSVSGWNKIKTVPYKTGEKIRILHSPTDRAAKGYKYILSAVENLKKKHPVEFVVIENMPNARALELYQQADLVIDQVLVGWYGGFAVEAMKMGKPVAAYIREEDLKFIPKGMAQDLKDAIINIDPFNIDHVLSECLQDRSMLKRKSEAGIEYVFKWHDPLYVAGITKTVYEA